MPPPGILQPAHIPAPPAPHLSQSARSKKSCPGPEGYGKVVEPAEATVVLRIFEGFATGRSEPAIVRRVGKGGKGVARQGKGVARGSGLSLGSVTTRVSGLSLTVQHPGHGTPAQDRAPRRDLARYESGQRPAGHRRRRCRQGSLRRHARPRNPDGTLAAPCVGLDDQSLPPAGGDAGPEPRARDAAPQRRLLAGLQPAPWAGRPPVSGSIQGDSGRAGGPSAGAGAVRRPQPCASRHGQDTSGTSVEQLRRNRGAPGGGGLAGRGLDARTVREPAR